MENNLNTNKKENQFKCNFCDKSFKTMRYLARHTKKHNVKCNKCNITYETLTEKKEHEKLVHQQENLWTCKSCSNLSFLTEKEYLEHLKNAHQELKSKNNIFMCSDCGKQFKTKCELMHHINSKCGTIKLYSCKVCGQELMTAGSLHNHMLRHKGQRSFMCRFCAKLFLTGGQLKVHERIHTKEKAFKCEVCGKGFCHRQSLITHSTLHTGIKPFQCENCGNSFSCVGNLIKHRKTHADSCGLTPLTSHSVQNPSTKIKVKINTPETSKLKALEKNEELQKKLKFLGSGNENLSLENDCRGISAPINPTMPNWNDCDITKKESSTTFVQNQDKETNYKQLDVIVTENNEKTINCGETTDNETQNCDLNIISSNNKDNFINIIENETENEEINEPYDKNNENYSDDEYDSSENCDNSSTEDGNVTDAACKSEENKLEKKAQQKEKRLRRKHDPLYSVMKQFILERKLEGAKKGKCRYCKREYSQFRWLYKHEQYHLENGVKIIELDDENQVKINSSKGSFKCSCCKKHFQTKKECLEHQQSEHLEKLTCNDCDKIFANADSLRSHRHCYHKGIPRKEYAYICEKCGKKFKQKSLLLIHKERNCDNGPFFVCSVCKKEFCSEYSRKAHMRIHNSEKNLLCKFCGKSFHWKGQLKVHERSHTGEKPYTCLFCPRTFTYRDSLITHSSMHTGFKPHFCKSCGWRFSCIGNLAKHRASHASTCGAWYKENVDAGGD